jgi:hypothetical protein
MPMKDIKIMFLHKIKRLLDFINRKKVAADIEHKAAPLIFRLGRAKIGTVNGDGKEEETKTFK